MTDWLGSYGTEWSVFHVDPDTWADDGMVAGVASVSISRDCTDDVPLLETGTMEVDADFFDDGWYRIYMTAEQGSKEKVAMATLLFEQASSRVEMRARTIEARGRSTIQPVADEKTTREMFVAAGADGAAYAASIIAACTPAPVVVEGSFTLVEDYVLDIGEPRLSAVWGLLRAGGWCIQIDGDGTVRVREMPSEPALELDMAHAGLLIPGVDDDYSIVDVPNRYFAMDDGETAVAENIDGAAGYAARGRWVDVVDESPVLVNGESLEMYAARKLSEACTITRHYRYDREFWPNVTVNDMVRASLADNGIEGDLRVLSQSIDCGDGVKVSETAGMEVLL